MRRLILVLVLLLVSAGCGEQRSELTTIRELLSLAKEDKVEGRLRVTLNGNMEAGLKNGVYLGMPGAYANADLMIHLENVEGQVEQTDEVTSQ